MAVLDIDEVRRLYARRAEDYSLLTLPFRALGFGRHQTKLVTKLNLVNGSTVVDLCCGTGVNLAALSYAVGPCGTVVGVDLSEAMLVQASQRIRSAGLGNVKLVQADVQGYVLPAGTNAVLSTFGLEMVPAYERVIRNASERLPSGGRIGLLGLKHPERWPDWIIQAAITPLKPFGVSRDYEDFKPWIVADRHFVGQSFRQYLAGAAYSYIGEKVLDSVSLRNG